jgi:hypothetical protein
LKDTASEFGKYRRPVSTVFPPFLWYILTKTERRKVMEKEYTLLFNAVTSAIRELEILKEKLVLAQQEAEEAYIEK